MGTYCWSRLSIDIDLRSLIATTRLIRADMDLTPPMGVGDYRDGRIAGGTSRLPLGWMLMRWSVYIDRKQSTPGYPAPNCGAGGMPRQNNRTFPMFHDLLFVKVN